MENNQNQLQEEEIPNIEQFQVGRVPSEAEDQQSNTQNVEEDDDVELGFTEDEPEGEYVRDSQNVNTDTDEADTGGVEPGDEDADFDNPDDDPA